MEKTKLIAIKTDKGYYITDNINNNEYYSTRIKKLKFDGRKPKITFHKDWFIVIKAFSKITQEIQQPDINRRYELRDKKQFPKLKEVYKEEDALTKIETEDDDYVDKWGKEFAEVKSLYDFKSDRQMPIDEPVEFELTVIGEMKSIPGNTPFEYEVENPADYGETYNITNNDIVRNLIDKVVTPPILVHLKSCGLTSHDTYSIVRQYVKQNIDFKVAKITSDYDFCFTVQKVIKLAEDEEYLADISGWKSKKPKYVTKYRTDRKVEIFEMGWSPKCYGVYTPIEGFIGKNEKDLKKKIDKFLKELIDKINEPLIECPQCKGLGVIIQKEKENE